MATLPAVADAAVSAAATVGVQPGDALVHVLREYQARGLRLIWSSQLVRDELTVRTAPRGDSPEQQLRSLLEPLGLDLQPLGADSWVVVERNAPREPAAERPTPPPQSLDTIVVQTSRYDVGRADNGGATSLSRNNIEKLPGTGQDVARSLQQLPGTAAGDYSARTHIRGSRDDETLFRFDGVTLVDPFHLKNFQGLFSALDPGVTESVQFWTGDLPIEFGGSIGAVADIVPREPTRLLAEAGVSVLDSNALLGMPLADGRGSLLISGRVGNLAHVARLLDKNIGEPDFRDLTLRTTWRVNDRLHFSAGLLALDDSVNLTTSDPLQQADAHYRDLYAWARAGYDLPDGWHGETLLSTATLDAHRDARADRPGIDQGSLQELRDSRVFTLRQELGAPLGERLSVRGGAEYTHSDSQAMIDSVANFSAPFFPGVQPVAQVLHSLDVPSRYATFALYGAARWEIRGGDVVEAGLRRDSQHFQSEVERSQWNLRLNWWHRFNPDLTLRIAWGQYSQPEAASRLDVADGISELESARRARQTSISLEQRLGAHWLLRVGAYDKRESSSLTTFENLFSLLVLTPEIEVDRLSYTSSGARMRGLELTLQSDPDRPLNGWISYTRSRAVDRIDGIDVPRSWDQPHALQAGVQWRHGPWQAAGHFNWHSGWPYTPLFASAQSWTDPHAVTLRLGARNSLRQEAFRSVDLRLAWTHPLLRGEFEASLELRNAFNSDNECCRNYQVVNVNGRSTLVENARNWLPVTPILGVRWRLR